MKYDKITLLLLAFIIGLVIGISVTINVSISTEGEKTKSNDKRIEAIEKTIEKNGMTIATTENEVMEYGETR